MSSMTVDPDRVVTEDEQKALVAVEVAERLAVRAHRRVEEIRQTLLSHDSGFGSQMAANLIEVQDYLALLTDVTTNRTCTAVKDQSMSDAISREAATRVQRGLRLIGRA